MYKYLAILFPVLFTVTEIEVQQEVKIRTSISGVSEVQQLYIDSIINVAQSYTGTPYCYGGSSNKGIDCSGLMRKSFAAVNFELPYTSSAIGTMGIEVNVDSVQAGDLLFFTGRNSSSSSVGHVSLVIENDSLGIRMIHATSRGVVTDYLNEQDYYQKRLLFARRIPVVTFL